MSPANLEQRVERPTTIAAIAARLRRELGCRGCDRLAALRPGLLTGSGISINRAFARWPGILRQRPGLPGELIGPLSQWFSDIDLACIAAASRDFAMARQYGAVLRRKHQPPRFTRTAASRHVETPSQVERVDLDDLFETKRVRRIGTAAIFIAIVTGAVIGLKTSEAKIAAGRLLLPFSEQCGRRKRNFRLLMRRKTFDAERPRVQLAAGKRFELYVENLKGDLPGDTVVQYRQPRRDVVSEHPRQTRSTDHSGEHRDVGSSVSLRQRGRLVSCDQRR